MNFTNYTSLKTVAKHAKRLRLQLAAIDTAQSIDDIDLPRFALHPLKGKSAVTPEMALRLSKVLGRTPESWLSMQDNYELWKARKKLNLAKIKPLKILSA